MKQFYQAVVKIVSESQKKHTPIELENLLIRRYHLHKKKARTILKELVVQGALEYTYQFGRTFLEISYRRPISISKKITLVPHGLSYQPSLDEIEIKIKSGASFGMGDHPSTRLALQGIEFGIDFLDFDPADSHTKILDVGTGSGVLLLAALKMGIQEGVGIDIDPCARAESRENLKINRITGRAVISDQSIADLDGWFTMITANLRYPTLLEMKPSLIQKLKKKGVLILSGIKSNEIKPLMKHYLNEDLKCVWKEREKNWSGAVFLSTDD